MERTLSLVRFSRAEGGQVGIGIVPVTERRVQTKPAVRIRADHIGGPSAGLMFALEILNQLTPEDLTRGLKIAGTGTLSAEGEVGQIGGVEQKVMAAEREGAAGGAGGGEEAEGAEREIARLKAAEELDAHGPGGADDGDEGVVGAVRGGGAGVVEVRHGDVSC